MKKWGIELQHKKIISYSCLTCASYSEWGHTIEKEEVKSHLEKGHGVVITTELYLREKEAYLRDYLKKEEA